MLVKPNELIHADNKKIYEWLINAISINIKTYRPLDLGVIAA